MAEIENKAEEWFKYNVGELDSFYLYPSNNEELIKTAYKAGYEQRQKELEGVIFKLNNQIEKMKNCSTCKYKYKDTCYLKLMKNTVCQNKDKWELDE